VAPSIINPDKFLETPDGRVWTPERNAEAWRLAFDALDFALSERKLAGLNVVIVCGLQGSGKSTWIAQNGVRSPNIIYFDAALPRARHRAPIVEIARKHSASVEVVWINVPFDVALQRNAQRPTDQIVPEASIASVAALFEPPSKDEGFTTVSIVTA
jgi:predicted kinase